MESENRRGGGQETRLTNDTTTALAAIGGLGGVDLATARLPRYLLIVCAGATNHVFSDGSERLLQ